MILENFLSNLILKHSSQKMIDELEEEVAEMRAIVVRSGANQLKMLEDETKRLKAEVSDLKKQNDDLTQESSEYSNLK